MTYPAFDMAAAARPFLLRLEGTAEAGASCGSAISTFVRLDLLRPVPDDRFGVSWGRLGLNSSEVGALRLREEGGGRAGVTEG